MERRTLKADQCRRLPMRYDGSMVVSELRGGCRCVRWIPGAAWLMDEPRLVLDPVIMTLWGPELYDLEFTRSPERWT